MNTVEVDVKSAWLSKINWTQAVAFLAMLATVFGFDLDPKTQVAIVAGIQSVQSVVTWILKTFFNKTVTPTVAAKA
jgi:hypothetical protein